MTAEEGVLFGCVVACELDDVRVLQLLSTADRISVATRSAVSSSNGAALSMMKVDTPISFHAIISSVIRSCDVT